MTKDMTNGKPMKLILGFALPMLLGYLFQQCYNLVDTLIVGRYLGVDSLAAVGSTGSINFLVIGFCMGVCVGFAIPVSQKFGAGDYVALRKYVANCVYLGAAFAAIMCFLTVTFCRNILEIMNTPADIIEEAYAYIVVIFIGIPTVFLYNMLSGIIRALGDSRTPVIFLLISSVINICLDLVFIINFNMGVAGAALATCISQAISGILCFVYIVKKFEILHISGEEWKPEPGMMKTLCGMGIPMGLQYSITAIGSVVLQTAVNGLGSVYVAAMTTASKIGGFLMCPYEALGSTMATYGGQNVGARKLKRLKKGLADCIKLGAIYALIAVTVAYFFGEQLGRLFVETDDLALVEEIVANVRMFLLVNTGCYFLLALVNIVRFMIQGIGFPAFAVFAGVFEMVARALAGMILVPKFGFVGAAFGSPLAWLFADFFLIPAFFIVYRKLKLLYGEEATE